MFTVYTHNTFFRKTSGNSDDNFRNKQKKISFYDKEVLRVGIIPIAYLFSCQYICKLMYHKCIKINVAW